jgi:hypothetical protein
MPVRRVAFSAGAQPRPLVFGLRGCGAMADGHRLLNRFDGQDVLRHPAVSFKAVKTHCPASAKRLNGDRASVQPSTARGSSVDAIQDRVEGGCGASHRKTHRPSPAAAGPSVVPRHTTRTEAVRLPDGRGGAADRNCRHRCRAPQIIPGINRGRPMLGGRPARAAAFTGAFMRNGAPGGVAALSKGVPA